MCAGCQHLQLLTWTPSSACSWKLLQKSCGPVARELHTLLLLLETRLPHTLAFPGLSMLLWQLPMACPRAPCPPRALSSVCPSVSNPLNAHQVFDRAF